MPTDGILRNFVSGRVRPLNGLLANSYGTERALTDGILHEMPSVKCEEGVSKGSTGEVLRKKLRVVKER
jgi:hypothetical protein